MNTSTDKKAIKDLAYRLWEKRGRPVGSAEADWLEAERQLAKSQRTEAQIVEEAMKESFPASDPPASGLPDTPPVNADAKWAATTKVRQRAKRGRSSKGPKDKNR